MKIKVNSVLTLEDNNKYIILDVIDYMKKKYYFSMQLDNNLKIIPNNLLFLTIEQNENDEFIEILEDKKLIKDLIKLI